MLKPKYILIVSQYYHTYRMSAIRTEGLTEETYFEKARALITDLEAMKRRGGPYEKTPISYGDMDYRFFIGFKRRYNVNDSGDIYFIPCYSEDDLILGVRAYEKESATHARGYKKNEVLRKIGENHSPDAFTTLVHQHFKPGRSEIMKRGKLRVADAGSLLWYCPACKMWHGGANWNFNGDYDKPTFSPSFLVKSGHYVSGQEGKDCWCKYNKEHPEDASPFTCGICHTFVRDGKIEYLPDCTHELAGQTIDLTAGPEEE